MLQNHTPIILRLIPLFIYNALAMLLGGIIGFEREAADKPAVCAFSCTTDR